MPSLEELIMGSIAQGTKLGAEGAQQRQKADLDAARQAQEIAQAQALRKQYGEDTPIAIGGAHIGASDKLGNFIKMQGLGNKTTDDKRLETKALQDEYQRLAGPTRERASGFSEIENLLTNPSNLTFGQLQTALARLRDKGALSEGDVSRTLPRSLKGDISRLGNYLLNRQESPLTKEQLDAAKAYIKQERELATKKLGANIGELRGRAQVLAPTLSKTKELDPTLESLGAGAQQLLQDSGVQNPLSIQDPVERLKALRAKHKK